jgi:hypothetical protein
VRQSSHFSATVPLNYPGAAEALASLGDNESGVIVESNGKTGTLVMGEIDTTNFIYGQNGTITAAGRCNSVKLHNKIYHGTPTNMTTVALVAQMAGLAGLGFDSGGGGPPMMVGKELDDEFVESIDGQTLAAIVSKCAELDDARWWVDPASVLHYDIKPQPGGGYSVSYSSGPPESSDFFTLSIERNVQAGKTIKVTVKSFQEEDKNTAEPTAEVEGRGGPVEYEIHVPRWKEEQAQQYAQNKADEIARHEITVKAHVVGDPTIDVSVGLAVAGTGFWDQAYVIDTIHHQFGMPGHTMTITARGGLGGRGG